VKGSLALLLAVSSAGCAYFNSMWTAERYAKDARRFEQRGQLSEARSQWALAAAKAERVVIRHPRSRWADDALTLQAEGLARSGACVDAAGPIARVRETVKDLALLERAELADAECALAAGRPIAEAALALPLASKDAGRRSRAEHLRAMTLQRARIDQASQRTDLVPIAYELKRIGNEPLYDLARRLLLAPAGTLAARFRMAELARDSLQAPLLAGQLFLEVAAGDTASLYAPKALLAALALLPDRRDSIAAVLDTRYAASPYTRAYHGEASVAYAAAEDSLARELGVQVARTSGSPLGVRFGRPLPGPRGPRP
jgi:hypothetical protein